MLEGEAGGSFAGGCYPLGIGEGVGFVDELLEEGPGHGVVVAPGDNSRSGRVVAGEDDCVTANDGVVAFRVDIPDCKRRLAGRHHELRNVEADVADAAVLDGVLYGGDVRDIHFDEGGELVALAAFGAVGRALVEQEGEDVLLVASGSFAGLVGVVAAGLLVEVDDINIRLGVDLCWALVAPDLESMIVGGAGAVAEGVVAP